MKKSTDYLKQSVLIILGALLFIYYLNYLSAKGLSLGIGIVAIVISAFYLVTGIVLVIAGNISPSIQKTFNTIAIALFAVFMFVRFLLTTIGAAKLMEPTGWTIKIVSMVASLAFVVIYSIVKFSGKPMMSRLNNLFSLIFILVLILDVLFDVYGNSITLGRFDVLLVAIYGFYAYYLLEVCEKTEVLPEQPKTEEDPAKE